MVDDAHGTGGIGPGGRGSVAAAGLEDEVDILVGTLGKTLGSYGAFVCCERRMAKFLINTARTFIFSTALAPPQVAAAMAALELLRENPGRADKLLRNAAILRESLAEEGLQTPAGTTQILPLVIGDADTAVAVSNQALEHGVFATAIRPPTVPEGTSRLRLTVMASHTKAELKDAARTIARAVPASARKIAVQHSIAAEATALATAESRGSRVFDGLADAA